MRTRGLESGGGVWYREEVVDLAVPAQDGIPAHTVPGTLCVPARTDGLRLPGVVMLPGSGCDRDETADAFRRAAAIMAGAGIASLRIDFMGSGDSQASQADYNFTSANLDAKAAADYLAAQSYIDPGRLAVLGKSQGGTNALLAAGKYPDTFRAVVCWSGAVDVKIVAGNFNLAYEIARMQGSYQADPQQKPLGKRWFDEVDGTDVLKVVSRLRSPVLAVNGDADTLVPSFTAVLIADAAKNGTAHILKGVDHNYNLFTDDPGSYFEVVDATIAFLRENLEEEN